MSRIIKFSGYAVDANGDASDIDYLIEHYADYYLQHFHAQEAEFEWDDDNPLNYKNCDLAECEKYFKADPSDLTGRQINIGETYRHFKGNLVTVLAISQDTESPGAWSVVYKCLDKDNCGKIWHRPYDMFISEVDHKKYPEVTQKYRFELERIEES